MSVFATAGTRVFIGTSFNKDTDIVIGDVSALVYTEIGNTTNIGQFGDTASTVTSDEIGRGRTRKVKGVRNAGNMTLTCNINGVDPGQNALRAAQLDQTNDYAFKVVFPDAPATGSNPQGSTRYFLGKVMNDSENLAGANTFAQTPFSIEVDSNVLKIPASSGT